VNFFKLHGFDAGQNRVEKERDESTGHDAGTEHLRQGDRQNIEHFGSRPDTDARPERDREDEPFARR